MATKEYVNPMVFSGGVNTTLPDELIEDQELADSRNFHPDVSGTGNLIKRAGVKATSAGTTYTDVTTNNHSAYSSIFAGSTGVYYVESYTLTTGPTNVFNLYKASDGTVNYTDSTLMGGYPAWTVFNGYDIYVDGAHNLKITASTEADIPAMPNAEAVAAYNNYLFCVSARTANTITLRWSAAHDETTWAATNELKLITDSVNYGTALCWWDDTLVVACPTRIFFVQGYGPLDFTVTRHIEGTGCLLQQQIVATPFGLFYWDSQRGLATTKDGFNVDFPFKRKLSSLLSNSVVYSAIGAVVVYRPDHRCIRCYVFGSVDAFNSELICDYYPEGDRWFLHGGTAAQASSAAFDRALSAAGIGTQKQYLLYWDRTAVTGKLYCREEDDTLARDLGVDYTSYVKTKRYSQSSPLALKTSRQLLVTTKQTTAGDLTVDMYQDNATSATRSTTITPGTGVQDTMVSTNLAHRKIQFKISDAANARNELIGAYESGTVEKLL